MRTLTVQRRSKWWDSAAILLLAVSLLISGGCSSNDSSSPPPPPPLYGPGNVAATAETPGSAVVSWNAIAGVTGYNIYYSNTSPVNTATATRRNSADNNFTLTNLDYKMSYYIVVTALYGTSESLASEMATLKLPPPAPLEVMAMATSPSGTPLVTVSWTDVASSATYPITYNIYKSTASPVPTGTPLMGNYALTTYDDSAVLADGTMYYYVVTAEGPGGESEPSTEVGVIPVIPAGAPVNVSVIRTPETTLSATLSWNKPGTGTPTSYEIYRALTGGTAYNPANHVASVPAGTYKYIDNSGLVGNTTYYWVVSAKNSGGETPSSEVSLKVIGSPMGGGGGDTGFGNNFSSALIFADGIGITGLTTSGTWTTDVASIDFNTGLRPLSTEIAGYTTLPILRSADTYTLNDVAYYMQQTASTWQGEWFNGSGEPQHVTAKWGDNLLSSNITSNSVLRIEMVLSKPVTTAMTSYTMQSLYGSQEGEMQGTDGTTYANTTAFVFASNVHLVIEKLDNNGVPIVPALYDQTLWTGDGPGFLGGEINISGGFTYGFIWTLNSQVLPPEIPSLVGTWRLTFKLDQTSPKGTANNTFIDAVGNGVRVSDTVVYIDITVQ